jgi:hypothetical protein
MGRQLPSAYFEKVILFRLANISCEMDHQVMGWRDRIAKWQHDAGSPRISGERQATGYQDGTGDEIIEDPKVYIAKITCLCHHMNKHSTIYNQSCSNLQLVAKPNAQSCWSLAAIIVTRRSSHCLVSLVGASNIWSCNDESLWKRSDIQGRYSRSLSIGCRFNWWLAWKLRMWKCFIIIGWWRGNGGTNLVVCAHGSAYC